MKFYNQNVTIVMQFLCENDYGNTAVYAHKKCYRLLKDHMREQKGDFSVAVCNDWYTEFRNSLSPDSNTYKGMSIALLRLQDVYEVGYVKNEHITFSKPPYTLLNNLLKQEIDTFVTHEKTKGYPDSYLSVIRSTGSWFMLFIMNKGLSSILQVNYDTVFSFYERDNQPRNEYKDRCDCVASRMLEYFSANNPRLFGMSLTLNKLLIHQVMKDFSFLSGMIIPSIDLLPINKLWAVIEEFIAELKRARYSNIVIKTSKHTLSLLYIFRDMFANSLDEKLVWQWFEHAIELFGTGWKQYRRTLYQFLSYLNSGVLITKSTGDPKKLNNIDYVDDGLKKHIIRFLALKKREGYAKSTLDMYRTSIVKLALFLQTKGINDFSVISPDLILEFNSKDEHFTIEGKQAYNCKIRLFLAFLMEEEILDNPHVANSVPTIASAKVGIPATLTHEEVQIILASNVSNSNPMLLRDYAMIMLALSTGLRASDIVNLKFEDIDWTQQKLSVIQQKTGKLIQTYLNVKAGNALYRYIKYGRPQSHLAYIFIKHAAPYNNLNKAVCCRALYKFLPNYLSSNVGFHILRKTFATGMLHGDNKVELIADALGHRGDSTVYTYLGLDSDRMRMCPLPLSETGTDWHGGDFFD